MKLKYYLRGMGIGALVATIILIIALSYHSQDISDSKVIARAKELGMVMESQQRGESIPEGTEQPESETDSESTTLPAQTERPIETETSGNEDQPVKPSESVHPESESDVTEQTVKPPEQTAAESKPVKFTIQRGDSSDEVARRLYEAGLVDDADQFNTYLMKHHYANSILPGTISIPAGSTYKKIAKLLTSSR